MPIPKCIKCGGRLFEHKFNKVLLQMCSKCLYINIIKQKKYMDLLKLPLDQIKLRVLVREERRESEKEERRFRNKGYISAWLTDKEYVRKTEVYKIKLRFKEKISGAISFAGTIYVKNLGYATILDIESDGDSQSITIETDSWPDYWYYCLLRPVFTTFLLETQERIFNEIVNNYMNTRLYKLLFKNERYSYKETINIEEKPPSIFDISQRKAYLSIVGLDKKKYFTLIKGPPGTGKTTVIGEAIKTLASKGAKILVTSHTNVAIDNIFEKLNKTKLVYRLGIRSKILPSVRKYHVSDEIALDEIDKINVIGATLYKIIMLLGLEKLKIKEIFDWVIVDEASMATIPLIIPALMLGRRFVLVGDDQQLPPISRSHEDYYDISLFEILLHNFPNKSILLQTQYRMPKILADWSSKLFYENKITTKVNRKINVPVVWIDTSKIVNFNIGKRILRYKHEPIKLSYRSKRSFYNILNAAIVLMIIKEYLVKNKNLKNVLDKTVIITPYRAQRKLLNYALRNIFNIEDIAFHLDMKEISTVDAFQGREAENVIFDITATKEHRALLDYRRINVAITRTKKLLIIVGKPNVSLITRHFYLYIKKRNQKIIVINENQIKKDLIQQYLKIIRENVSKYLLVNEKL